MGRFIIAIQSGNITIGYLESSSEAKNCISITPMKGLAKKFTTEKACWTQINKLVASYPVTFKIIQIF